MSLAAVHIRLKVVSTIPLVMESGPMPDEAIKNALAEKAKLLKDIAKIDDFIAQYERFSGTKVEDTEPQSGENGESREPSRRTRYVTPTAVVPIIRRIISEKGVPMTRGEIVKALHERDVSLKGKDEPRYVGTVLWRHKDDFVNIEGYGYWLVDEPCESVGYFPKVVKASTQPSMWGE